MGRSTSTAGALKLQPALAVLISRRWWPPGKCEYDKCRQRRSRLWLRRVGRRGASAPQSATTGEAGAPAIITVYEFN